MDLRTGDGEGGCPPGDTTMRLFGFDAEGAREELAFNDDAPGQGLCSRIQRVLPAGDYEVEVQGFGNGPHAGYVLTVTIPRAPRRGELLITEVMQNPRAVSDDNGEWFEVYNAAAAPLQLRGVRFADDAAAAEFFDVDQDLVIPPGAFAVMARRAVDVNGGVEADFVYFDDARQTLSLGNGADGIIVLDANGDEISRVVWDDGDTFPDPNGASMTFDGALAPELDAVADGGNWCDATSDFGAGDLGTPGASNDECAGGGGDVVEVNIENFAFDPAEISIAPGTTVRWTNLDGAGHTVTSRDGNNNLTRDPLDSPLLQQNGAFEFTFDEAGTFDYRCAPHGFMQGAVIVE